MHYSKLSRDGTENFTAALDGLTTKIKSCPQVSTTLLEPGTLAHRFLWKHGNGINSGRETMIILELVLFIAEMISGLFNKKQPEIESLPEERPNWMPKI